MPSLLLMDMDFTLLAELPQFVGLTLKRAYWDTGAFKLTMGRGMPGWDLLRRDALLYFPNAPHKAMLIEKLTVTESRVTADGVPLKGLAKRRVAAPSASGDEDDPYRGFGWDRITADAETAYLHYAEQNLTNPADTKRKMPRLTLAENLHRGETLPWQARFDKLHELFADIGEKTGVGWDIRPDFAARTFVFGAHAGRDRTTGTGRAVIARRVGNADGTTLCDDGSAAVSTVYGGGAGEDESRFILSVGSEAEGLSRREAWTEVSGTEDADMLRMGARRKLLANKLTLTAEVCDTGMCRYERDYDLGDLVTLVADGRQTDTRLICMEEIYERGVRRLKATFGDQPVTLTELLRLKERGVVR